MAAPSTTDLVQLSQLVDNVIILKDGSLRAVVEVNAINFDLRSSDEQSAILQQFEAFLNSIDFPIQIVVESRRFDVSGYLETIKTAADSLTNELLRVQAEEYARFVGELSELANIMSKRFFIVLRLTATAASETNKKGFFSGIADAFKSKAPSSATVPVEKLAAYQQQLAQRADFVLGGLSGMGLGGHTLGHDELGKLFHDLYNPTVPPAHTTT
jgi:type IV secretory pathway VirB4 component